MYESYSERKRERERAGQADVYVYNHVPDKLREQIIHLWTQAFGDVMSSPGSSIYANVATTVAAAIGVATISRKQFDDDKCADFIRAADIDGALDIIEFAAIYMARLGAARSRPYISDLNRRFQQHSVGYRFENGQIIRIDDQFTHAEIVKPALGLLISDPIYKTANDHFMEAHAHYRAGENAQAVTMAGTAFESTLKAICTQKGWQFDKGARATDLIKIVNAAGLFPDYLDKGFDSYIAAMKTGLPGVRNYAGSAHGKAPGTEAVPDYITAYAIHLSAANIVLAIEASRGNHKPRPAPKAPQPTLGDALSKQKQRN